MFLLVAKIKKNGQRTEKYRPFLLRRSYMYPGENYHILSVIHILGEVAADSSEDKHNDTKAEPVWLFQAED